MVTVSTSVTSGYSDVCDREAKTSGRRDLGGVEDAGMRIALAQLNAVVGDLEGNVERIVAAVSEAQRAAADLVVLPELAVTGYPPEDLLLRPGFVRAAREAVDEVARACTGTVALVGAPAFDRDLANAAFVCAEGTVKGVYRKHFLPNYGVFDEHRYFAAGRELLLLEMGDVLVGPTICEDVWQPGPPATDLALAGATLLVNLSASPFHVGKAEDREEMLVTRARDNASYVAFCNLVGGQDELVFDGHSVVLDDEGEVVARAPGFEETLLVVDVDPTEAVGRRLRDVRRRELERSLPAPPSVSTVRLAAPRAVGEPVAAAVTPFEPELEQMRLGLGLGLRDYVTKNGFGDVVIAISGGIDSALTAAIAADALGPARVHTVSMPSRFSSEGTRDDAREVSENLGVDFREVPIEAIVGTYHAALGGLEGLAAENLQARIRGTMLMALSNTHGWLVLATGNKSEMAVGYATIYGDMVGGYALLKDVFKTDVWRLSRHLNERAGRELIPVTTIERPPSAELRDDQRDDQSLPPYDVLDPLLEAYVELDRSREELEAQFDPAIVERTLQLVDRAEYKRRQAAPGVKLRPRAFGRDWRTPITNRWRG
jgi:NAD+ synthase (glutamine-hydrolysing)